MAKNWKQLLDSQDDVEVDIGGEKLKLSELRALTNEQVATIKRQAEADVARADETLAALIAAQPQPTAQNQPAARTVETQTFEIPESDPVLGPLVKRLNASEATNKQVIDALKQLSQGVNNNVAASIDLTYREAFERNKENYPGVDSYEAARDYAAKNRIFNQRGIIDPLAAADRMSAKTRYDRDISKAREEAAAAERTKVLAEMESKAGALAFAMPGVSRSRGEASYKTDKKLSLQENLRNAIASGLPKALQAGRA